MIWATVSFWSCFCWLYRASPSLAAKNIISLISVLTIWWCPCALGITYYIHCAWKHQSSGRLERANHFLKSVIKKITQETSLGRKEALPIAFLCTRISPKEQVSLSPYETLYGSPFVYVSDLFLDPSSLILWPLSNSNRIYACGVSKRTHKFLKATTMFSRGSSHNESLERWVTKGSTPAHVEGPLPCNTFYPHSSQGNRTWLLDLPLMSQAMEKNRGGHLIHLWAPGRSQISIQNYKSVSF